VGTITGATVSMTLPNGLSYWWYDSSCPMYVKWNDANKTFTATATGPVNPGTYPSLGIDRATTAAYETPAISVTRSISNPIFSDPNNVEKRIVTLTLDVPASALSAYNSLIVRPVNSWEMPNGLRVQSITDMNVPSGFSSWSPGEYGIFNSSGLGGLSGQYSFVAQVEFARDGNMQQNVLGSLYFRPPASVNYNNHQDLTPGSGTTVSTTIDANVVVTFSAGNTFDYTGSKETTKELWFDAVVAARDANASPSQFMMVREKRKSFTGQTIYGFMVDVEGGNIVNATFTTPGGVTYEMVPDSAWGFDRESTDANDLSIFGKGDYTITVRGVDANDVKTYTVPLNADYPTEFPSFNQPMGFEDANRRPVVSWAKPSDPNVFLTYAEMDQGDYYGGAFGDPNITWCTPTQDFDLGGAGAFVFFASGQQGITNGGSYFSGFGTSADLYLNVVPEPATLALLGAGAAALILRRRKR
jgi:hypothetical protein